ncbi:Hypothetical predicted protein [Olea europaea subsp. europaea]|uniref:DUF1985 domain-containing protein n=1 Tax=Olea europaea subsp. europaea TaxID=158383 RepID=A0A8S0PZE6_OLEEU|nr:Hypothetical predicted protein [Olea europaea subsp. europaea]
MHLAGQMKFKFLNPKDARLQIHISQRSNQKYVKTMMDHFDERQREHFRSSPLGYLAEVPDIQFSIQLILQLVFRSVYTEKVNELWFNVQGHLMRFGLHEYTLVTGLRCCLFSEDDDFDRLIERKRLKERFGCTRQFQRLGNASLHMYATLRPTNAEAKQPYFSTFMPYNNPPVPMLDDIARTILALQFCPSHGGSRVGGQSGRQDSDDGVCSEGSGDDETSGDDGRDGQSGSDRDGDDSENHDGDDSEILHVTFECTRLREFITVLVAPLVLTTAPSSTGANVEAGVLGSSPQDIYGQATEPLRTPIDMGVDTGRSQPLDRAYSALCTDDEDLLVGTEHLPYGATTELSHAATVSNVELDGCNVMDGEGKFITCVTSALP